MYPKHNKDIFYLSSCRDIRFKDYLLLGGGTDIDPALYGEKPSPYTQTPHKQRDRANIKAIEQASIDGVPVIGICRGFQLLDVYNGGKLFQHSVGHQSEVSIGVEEDEDGYISNCASCHHQVVDREYSTGHLLGWSSSPRLIVHTGKTPYDTKPLYHTPQILYWEKQKHFAVQFHPEWQNSQHEMNIWISDFLKNTFNLENVL